MPTEFSHLLSGEKGKVKEAIVINDIFKKLPLALLKMKQPSTERGAGILLSVTSLPSPFGIGDIGKDAYSFVKFLSRSRQKYWQILPLNPTEAGAGHSPYSSYSSMAGNALFFHNQQPCDYQDQQDLDPKALFPDRHQEYPGK